jgi:hypothetical protein
MGGRVRRLVGFVLVAVAAVHVASAQALLDRVLARVGRVAITMSDVREAAGLGLIEGVPGDDQAAALDRVIDRQLLLDEVARFPPADPSETAVDEEVAAMLAHAGTGRDTLFAAVGRDEEHLRELARDSLRIRAYLTQRFGTSAQVREDDVRAYYEAHLDQFRRDGVLIPFEGAEAEARQRASAERLRSMIAEWTADLRTRAEIVRIAP